MKKLLLILLCLPLLFGSCKKNEGCTDFLADNYDIDSDSDDGSCQYLGCTSTSVGAQGQNADFIDYDANVDDGSCTFSLHISSVIASPTQSESVSLRNNSGLSLDISNYTIGDLNSPNEYSIPNFTILNQGEYLHTDASSMGFGINNTNERIYLKDNQGITVSIWTN